jgi:hypothetical protein
MSTIVLIALTSNSSLVELPLGDQGRYGVHPRVGVEVASYRHLALLELYHSGDIYLDSGELEEGTLNCLDLIIARDQGCNTVVDEYR